MLGSLRQAARAVSRASTRSVSTSSKTLGGGHGGDDYLHAPNMYNIPSMKNRKFKFGAAIIAIVLGGGSIPFIAAEFQQYKARG